MEQAVLTIEYSRKRRMDVALPVNIRTRPLAEALAAALQEPAQAAYFLAVQTADGTRRLPNHATLGDLGVLSGMSLSLVSEDQEVSFPSGSGALLLTESGDPLPLAGSHWVLGRSDASRGIFVDVDLAPFDLRKVISRKHAGIALKDGSYLLQDNGSTNGTFVNQKRLGAGETVELKNGDVLAFGRAEKGGIRVTFCTRTS